MKRLLFAVCFLFSGCSSSMWSLHPGYSSDRDWVEQRSVVTVFTTCMTPEGISQRVGTGVKVTATNVITARHVVDCRKQKTDRPLLPWKIIVRELDGRELEAVVDELQRDERDVALLSTTNGRSYQEPFAEPDPDSVPSIGEQVCSVGGTPFPNLYTCGKVISSDRECLIVGAEAIPGESGSPIYDRHGSVIGILVRGSIDPGTQKWLCAVPTASWRDLIRRPIPDPMANDW